MRSYHLWGMQQSEGGESEYADDAEDEVPDEEDELQSEDEDRVGGKRSMLRMDVFMVV